MEPSKAEMPKTAPLEENFLTKMMGDGLKEQVKEMMKKNPFGLMLSSKDEATS